MKKIVIKLTENILITYIFSTKIIVNFFLKDEIIVLLYHGISNYPSEFHKRHNLNVKPRLLENHIIWLKEYFNIISPLDLIKKNKYKKKSVLFTFDDGDKSILTDAIPIMDKYKIPSINFINLSAIYNDKIFWPGLITYLYDDDKFISFLNDKKIKISGYLEITPKIIELYLKTIDSENLTKKINKYVGNFLTFNDLKVISKNKLVYIGNHLYEHLNAVSISNEIIKDNYNKNNNILESFQNYVNFYAYPFGKNKISYDKRTNEIIKELNPKAIFLNDGETNNYQDVFYVNRIAMHERLDSKRILISYIVLNKIKNIIKKIISKKY